MEKVSKIVDDLIISIREVINNREELQREILIALGIFFCSIFGIMLFFFPVRIVCMIIILLVSIIAMIIEPYVGILVMVFVYFVILANLRYTAGVGELRPIFYIVYGTLLTMLYNKAAKRNFKFVYSSEDFALGFLWITMVISTFTAVVSKEISWDKNVDFLKTIVTYFLITNLVTTQLRANIFFWTVAGGTFALGLQGIRSYVSSGFVRTKFDLIGGGELGGANELASTLGMLVPFSYYKIFSRNWLEKICAIIVFCVLILCIIFTGSRGGNLQLAGIIILMVLRTKERVKALIVLSLIIILFVLFAPQEYWDRMNTIKNYQQDESAMGRVEVWQTALNMWKDYPITGVGQRNFRLVWGKNISSTTYDTHNTYLQLLVEGGVLTLGAFLILICLVFRSTRFIRKHSDPQKYGLQIYYLTYSIEIGLIGLFIASFFGVFGYFNPLYWFIGLTSSLKNIMKTQKSSKNNKVSYDKD